MGVSRPRAGHDPHSPRVAHPGSTVDFVLAALSLVPLAWLIGEATEHAAHHTGPGIGEFLERTSATPPS